MASKGEAPCPKGSPLVDWELVMNIIKNNLNPRMETCGDFFYYCGTEGQAPCPRIM